MTVIPDVERVLKEFHEAKKPIGYVCATARVTIHMNGEKFSIFVYVCMYTRTHTHTHHRLCCISPVLAAKV